MEPTRTWKPVPNTKRIWNFNIFILPQQIKRIRHIDQMLKASKMKGMDSFGMKGIPIIRSFIEHVIVIQINNL